MRIEVAVEGVVSIIGVRVMMYSPPTRIGWYAIRAAITLATVAFIARETTLGHAKWFEILYFTRFV